MSDFEILKRLDAGAMDNFMRGGREKPCRGQILIHIGQTKNINQKSKPPLLSTGLCQKVRLLRSAQHL